MSDSDINKDNDTNKSAANDIKMLLNDIDNQYTFDNHHDWNVFIPVENPLSKRLKSANDESNEDNIDDMHSISLNRMLSRTNILDGLSECTPRTTLSKQLG
eukprot:362211_1